jgi:hypothetical protein
MADKARLLDLDNQSPVIQLFAAVVTVMTGGTLLFYLFLFSGSLVFGASMSEMLAAPGVNAGSREESILKYLQVAQQISMFIIPAIILSVSLRRGNESFLGISKLPDSIPIVLVVLLAFLLIPVTSFTGILNSRLVLPEWMAGFEDWMQTIYKYCNCCCYSFDSGRDDVQGNFATDIYKIIQVGAFWYMGNGYTFQCYSFTVFRISSKADSRTELWIPVFLEQKFMDSGYSTFNK